MLPFTADVLFAGFARDNQGLWPLPLVALVLALGVILLTLRPVRLGNRAIAVLLPAAWLWTGYGYFYLSRAQIDFLGPIYALLFLLEGVLVVWRGVVRDRLAFRFRPGVAGVAGLALALLATIALPLADAISQGWMSARLVGLAPAPTALFTLGLLLLNDGRPPLSLSVIPLLWTLIAGATGWILAIPQDLVLPVLGLVAFGLGIQSARSVQ